MPKRDFMKNTCDGSGFTFTGLNGQDYGYNNSGQPCAIGVQTTVPYNPPTLLGNSNMFQPYQPNPRTGSMFGSSGGSYVGVAEHHAITSNPHSGGGGASSGSFIPNVPTPHNVHTSAAAQAQAVTNYTSKTPSYTAQEMIEWLENVNNTQNLQFNLPYKEINLSGKNVTDGDMLFFAQRMSNFAFHLDNLQLNHNPFGDSGIQALFNCAFTVPLGRSVVHLKLNNCNFGDVGAELIAAYVRDGYMLATRSIDVSENNITANGEGYFVKALENPNTQDITITLASTANDMQKVGNEAMKAMYDFVVKGLRYAVQEHVKNNAGTKWDINRVRSDQEIDKWKDCKDTVFNIGMGYSAGLVKCASTSPSKDPYSMFICSSIQGGLEGIAQPETLHCIGDINQEVSDSCSIM